MTEERDTLIREIGRACELGDVSATHQLLHPAVVALVDSGGDLIAETEPVVGVIDVAQQLLELCRGASVTAGEVNGVLALIVRRALRVTSVVAFDTAAEHVTRVWITLNPLKLRRWNS